MRIGIRAGHNPQAQGASGILNEVVEDRKIYATVIKYLKLDKNDVIDVTPYSCISAEDLKRGVNEANAYKVDIFASIHLNAANGQGKGTEVLYYGSSATGKALATRVCNSITKLGFISRGAKSDVRGLYELKNTDAPAIIVECFFLDSVIDVALYRKLGIDAIGKAIAEGLVGHAINIVKPVSVINAQPRIDYVLKTQMFLNSMGILDVGGHRLVEDGIIGKLTFSALDNLNKKLGGK